MLPLVAILAWLPCPWDSITSADEAYWYAPVQTIYVDEEPTLEDVEKNLQRRNLRILENKTDER